MQRLILAAALAFATFAAQAQAATNWDLSIAVTYAPGPPIPAGKTDNGHVNVWVRDNGVSPAAIVGTVVKVDKGSPLKLTAVPLEFNRSYSMCVERLMPDDTGSAQPSGALCTNFTLTQAQVQIISNTSGVTATPTQP